MNYLVLLVNTGELTMSYEFTTPPASLPTDLVNELNESDSDLLHDVATYAEELAEHKERKSRLEDDDKEESKKPADDLPEDVPAKATITIKKINDNRYYYWQWRDGDKIKSKYKSPVNQEK
jgi:hypothetical protein